MNAPAIGHNSKEMTPFEANSILLIDLYEEAKNWLDGEVIENEEQAAALATLDSNIMEVAKALDALRKDEVAPFNDGKSAVQAKYNPLIQEKKGKAFLARQSIKQALAPYMIAKEKAQRKEAEEARLRAEALERAAQEAIQARDATNLDEVEASEALLEEAKQANKLSKKIHTQSASVKGDGRAKSIITTYEPILENKKLAGEWAWKRQPEKFYALIIKIAQEEFNTGNRSIPGIGVNEIKKVRG